MESLSNFARGTAHDFNNILSPILSYLEIVLEKSPELTDDTKNKIKIALESTMRAIESVRIIADCANNNVLEKEDFDISILVSELFGSINHEDSGKINMINELKE
jgi:signal transduction histidine kinase